MNTRYAIYAMPSPESAFWAFGSRIIGHDAVTGASDQIVPNGFAPDEWAQITAAPRQYGFHATLKAPFRLCESTNEADLLAAFTQFCAAQPEILLGPLQVRLTGRQARFVALTPDHQSDELHALERAAVLAFEPFRAALTEPESAKRQPHLLDDAARHYLETYGYPHIFERFRLHYTLTGPLDEKAAEAETALKQLYAAMVKEPQTRISRLGLFRQIAGDRFTVLSCQEIG